VGFSIVRKRSPQGSDRPCNEAAKVKEKANTRRIGLESRAGGIPIGKRLGATPSLSHFAAFVANDLEGKTDD
jgi:hypothetical protein